MNKSLLLSCMLLLMTGIAIAQIQNNASSNHANKFGATGHYSAHPE